MGALHVSIARGVAELKRVQEQDGCWKSRPEMGPLALAITALTEAWLGVLSPSDAKRYAVALKTEQQADGGFLLYPFAKGSSLGATAVCRAALKMCGVPSTAPVVRAAEVRIRALGGYEVVRDRLLSHGEPAAVFCVMAELIPAELLPPVSPDAAALPWSERMLDGRMHGGVPMVIYAVAAVRERFLKTSLLPMVLRAPTRMLARSRLSSYIGKFQNDDGSWNEAVFATVFALIALEGVGLGRTDPMIQRGVTWLETRKTRTANTIEISLFDGEIWETSFAMLALTACGVAAKDEAIQSGARYLADHQCKKPQPRVNQPKADAPRTGGWAFQKHNDTMPDCDDSGIALAALGATAAGGIRSLGPTIERGVAWLRGMQNQGGGFGSYVHGLPDRSPGVPLFAEPRGRIDNLANLVQMLTNPPPEYGDPAIADLCGRVLWGLGECGLGIDDPMVARCVRFLERDVCENGAWWGIWNPAYVTGTAFALIGLAKVGADLRAPYVANAIGWLVSVQNADGGFGEEAGSFFDPQLAGVGASNAPLTGIALRALAEMVAARVEETKARRAAERAAHYLVTHQEAHGAWPNGDYLFTIIPPTQYSWVHHRLYYPLFGLGRWLEVQTAAARARKRPRTRTT
jgi:squalene-hopene/tetraprenyl-beta-curcumene cyclase